MRGSCRRIVYLKTFPHAKSKVSVLSHAVFLLGLSCFCHRLLGRFFVHGSIFSGFLVEGFWCAMEGSDASSVSTSSDSVDFDEHNIWNSILELLFHVQVGGIFEILVDEIDLARVALS